MAQVWHADQHDGAMTQAQVGDLHWHDGDVWILTWREGPRRRWARVQLKQAKDEEWNSLES